MITRVPVESASEPGKRHWMVLTSRGWEHEDPTSCRWAMTHPQGKPCRHLEAAEEAAKNMSEQEIMDPEEAPVDASGRLAQPETAEEYLARMQAAREAQGVEASTAIEPYRGGQMAVLPEDARGELYRLIDEFDVDLLTQGVNQDRVESWCYTFRQDGQPITGLSIWGVVNTVREMAKHGEVIRCDEPKIQYEDEDEIRMSCTARRCLVNPQTGELIEVDICTRGLRQMKYQLVNVYEGSGNQRRQVYEDGKPKKERRDDPKWWEKAYSKAQRNAQLPLLREDARTAIITAYKATPKYAALAAGRPYTPLPEDAPRRRALSAPRAAAAPPPDEPGDPAPAAAPARPQQARGSIKPSADTIKAITAVVQELRETWDPDSYRQFFGEMQAEFFPGKNWQDGMASLNVPTAARMLSWVRRRRGDPPAEFDPEPDEVVEEMSDD